MSGAMLLWGIDLTTAASICEEVKWLGRIEGLLPALNLAVPGERIPRDF